MIEYLATAYFINFYTIPIIFVAFACIGVGVATLLRNETSSLYLVFMLFTGVVSAWAISLIFLLSSTEASLARTWGDWLLFFICLIPPFLYTFICLMNNIVKDEFYYLLGSYLGAAIIGYIIFSTSMFSGGVQQFSWGYFPQAGPYHYVYLGFFAACIGKVAQVFYREIRDAPSDSIHAQRNRTLLAGTIIGYIASVDFIPFYGVSLAPFGYIFILSGITVYAVAISEYELSGLTDDRIASEIFMTIDEAVFVTDFEGGIKLANRAARELLGIEVSDFDAINIKQFLERQDVFTSLQNQENERLETLRDCELVDSAAKRYHVRLKVSTISAGGGGNSQNHWFVFAAQDTTELKKTRSKLDQARYENSNTGLPNQRFYNKQKENNELPEQCKEAVYIISEDLRSIKANLDDTEAYHFLLNSVTSRIHALLSTEFLYQFDENEFLALSFGEESLMDRIQEFKQELSAPVDLGGDTVHVNFSIGVAKDYPIDQAVKFSQSAAMNDAVEKPGTVISRYSEDVSEEQKQYFDIKHNLLNAINEKKIEVHFHPQIVGDSIRGAEALIRWEHDRHGYVIPPKVIRAAIEMSYEDRLLEHVLSEGATNALSWDDNETLAVNISSKQLEYKDRLINMVQSVAEATGLSTERLEIELTEQAAVRNLDKTRSILKELKELNVSVALDDFGTGYSSFKSLIELPIDNLKIDKSFVLKVEDDPKNKRVIETAKDIAETLDLEVIAEGVETESHVKYLRELGINIMQGFYWTEPLSGEEYRTFESEFPGND